MSNTAKPASLPRAAYAAMFGQPKGDRIRLADTSLVIEVEHDHTRYGEEVKFGGKTGGPRFGTIPGLSRFRRSGHRFGDKNLRQNKSLSARSVGLPTQACLATHGIRV
nr:hypothetical protein [Methylobacterium aquaticum]